MLVAMSRACLFELLLMATATVIGFRPVIGQANSHQAGPVNSAGILYEVWHTHAAQAMAQVAAAGAQQLTTELVIRSNGTHTLNDVYGSINITSDIYNARPRLGFYCLYRHRPGDPSPPVPDCANISQTTQAHAQMLTAAGFDYIAADVTNWPMHNTETDISVVRPIEVLFEEWYSLRQRGIKTPQISVWPCSPANSTTWRYLVSKLYKNASYDDLLYKQDGKPVIFVPYRPGTCYDEDEVAAMEAQGLKVIKMWALFGPPTFAQDVWGFFSPCVSSADPDKYTTSMIDEPTCNQYASTVNGQVDEVSASGSFMLSQTALPFAAPGHMRGLTLHRLFKKVLETKAPNLFVSSFNEHIGGRQAPASPSKIAFNMGLPNDPQRLQVWVDTYGSEFSRDLEPTVEGGDKVWNVTVSCVQLYKSGKTCRDEPDSDCCTLEDKAVYANVWSLSDPAAQDFLLTNSTVERDALLKEGWKEVCHPIVGPSDFCVDTANPDGRNGPFILYNVSLPSTRPLYRCFDSKASKHSLSISPSCADVPNATAEFVLGYISTTLGGETLRALRRCVVSPGSSAKTHALDLACDFADSPVLGYVR